MNLFCLKRKSLNQAVMQRHENNFFTTDINETTTLYNVLTNNNINKDSEMCVTNNFSLFTTDFDAIVKF